MDETDRTESPRPSAGLRRATGKDRAEWFELLDGWDATERPYPEIVDWLTRDHGLSSWWAQKLTVEYEQARGTRAPGVRRGGTFTVTASKTVAVPVERLYSAFVDAEQRASWLPGVAMRERASRPERSARFDWDDDTSRVSVDFASKGEAKSQVAVAHERLPDSGTAERTKTYWQERLAALKSLLEQ